MKKVFFAFLAVGALSSCTQDLTCTCSYPETAYYYAYEDVTQCLGCNNEEADAFEAGCAVLDGVAAIAGGNCVID